MIQLDAATVLLQWAVGGMAFCWFTTRRRVIGVGYGWLLRGTYLALAALSLVIALRYGTVPLREVSTVGVMIAIVVAIVVSVQRRDVGVSGQRAEHDRRTERVAAMTGIERAGRTDDDPDTEVGAEFPPILDLIPALIGIVGLLAAAVDAAPDGGSDIALSILRTLAGAAFLGCVTDAMLLGHWYLVQPGLPRKLLNEIVTALGWIWPIEVISLLLPVGMISVFTGEVDDGWNGTLGWFWAASAVTTIVLVFVTKAALKERQYSAVMAATGLLYLAILTAFGTDLVARAVLDAG
ncbi:MAG: hypothetical protein RIB65_18710 [Ilumatobacter fluminis]|uniref:Uncharacterized protein n=1 Tax=Ilumatobacter fluminis TaxID=467091 RepID=A0A4R7HZ70_9ACTN|nr:hypothetical protein [Ilumatobacter fluminis]TDT16100.1 hypothetical protein BDK89_1682 [Ilumatobacter fluminis]